MDDKDQDIGKYKTSDYKIYISVKNQAYKIKGQILYTTEKYVIEVPCKSNT